MGTGLDPMARGLVGPDGWDDTGTAPACVGEGSCSCRPTSEPVAAAAKSGLRRASLCALSAANEDAEDISEEIPEQQPDCDSLVMVGRIVGQEGCKSRRVVTLG